MGASLLANTVCHSAWIVTDTPPSLAGKQSHRLQWCSQNSKIPCPLAAATKGHRSVPASCVSFFKGIKHGVRQWRIEIFRQHQLAFHSANSWCAGFSCVSEKALRPTLDCQSLDFCNQLTKHVSAHSAPIVLLPAKTFTIELLTQGWL